MPTSAARIADRPGNCGEVAPPSPAAMCALTGRLPATARAALAGAGWRRSLASWRRAGLTGAAGIAAFLLRLARVLESGLNAQVIDRPGQWWTVPAPLRTVHTSPHAAPDLV